MEIALIKVNLCTPQTTEKEPLPLLIQQSKNNCRYEFQANDDLEKFNHVKHFEQRNYIASRFNETNYPTRYQKFMNSFILDNTSLSILVMRNVNAFLMCLLFTILLIIANSKIKNSFLLAISFTVVPQGLFIASSINPSSWSYIGCTFSWAFLWIIVSADQKFTVSNYVAFAGWVLASLLAISSRWDSPLWLIFTNLTVLSLHFLTKKNSLKITAIFSGATLVSIIAYRLLGPPLLQSIYPSLTSEFFEPWNLVMAIGGGAKLALATPMRILGLEDFGWSQIQPPNEVFFGGVLFLVLVISFLITFKEIRIKMFFISFLVFFWMLSTSQVAKNPTWMYPFYLPRTGWSNDLFHSRYFLPVFPFFVGVAALISPKREKLVENARFKNALIVILTFTHAISLQSVGQIFRDNPSWYWPNFPINIDLVLTLGSISFFVFVLTVTKILRSVPSSSLLSLTFQCKI